MRPSQGGAGNWRITRRWRVILVILGFVPCATAWSQQAKFFGIRIVDEQTGRGVPLAELRTVSNAVYVTDSAGWAAIAEPDLANREVYIHIESPGYEVAKDGFGFRGKRMQLVPGQKETVKIRRTAIAERMYRVTGQGVFRDSELLGIDVPLDLPQRDAGITGQDSVQAVPYRGKMFWLWGDTNLANYPLGNFQVTAATSPLPDKLDQQKNIPLDYYFAEERPRQIRKMMPLAEPGAVWLFGLTNLTGPDNAETLIAHYSRQKKLGDVEEHGLATFDDEAGIFRRLKKLPLEEGWRFPRGNAVIVNEGGKDYIYFCQPFAHPRVAAERKAIIDPQAYESLVWDQAAEDYRWQKETPPTTQKDEQRLIEAGKLSPDKARYALTDAQAESAVIIHRASICWNEFCNGWVMIGNQEGSRDAPSYLGEVWYAVADSIEGPWRRAVKIATHPRYSFYNPRQHPFLAEEEGRFIYFEGTYTRMFSASSTPTPRYDYNQLMYRLDLEDERLKAARD